jgi:hypothetical protein
MIQIERLRELTTVPMHIHVFGDSFEYWRLRIATGDDSQHSRLMTWQHRYIADEASLAILHMHKQSAVLVPMYVTALEIAQLVTAQATGTQEVYQVWPVLRLKMTIVLFDTAGPGDTGPGSARNSHTDSELPIIEEQAQRCTFHLQGIRTFTVGKLLLEIYGGQLVGTWIQLHQADHLVSRARPLHKPDGMFLVHTPRLK